MKKEAIVLRVLLTQPSCSTFKFLYPGKTMPTRLVHTAEPGRSQAMQEVLGGDGTPQ